ncbi:MAG: HigA family addiction module antitoxin [Planctomycetota bacterium]
MGKLKRKPVHPGEILEEHYIKPLQLNLEELANNLMIARNTLYKLRKAKASITPNLARRLAKAFKTSPELWLNLQHKYDLWELEYHQENLKQIKVLV